MSLSRNLRAALDSRKQRQILRQLPEPVSLSRNSNSAPAIGNVGSETPKELIDFCSNDYLSLTTSPVLRELYLKKLHAARDILGSGGSRLLVNGSAHQALENRLARFLGCPAGAGSTTATTKYASQSQNLATEALLFNSGFDANVGFFSCIPQSGDVVLYDEHIHASVHDGIRASRAKSPSHHFAFTHNSPHALRSLLSSLVQTRPELRDGESSVIVAVESLYSMDGTFGPVEEYVRVLDELLPERNGYLVVDEAHATGVYGPGGKGIVSGLPREVQERVFARLCTFGKALGGSGAVLLINPLVKAYLLNYARSLIYTTSLSHATIIAMDCSMDLLESGYVSKLAEQLMNLTSYTLTTLSSALRAFPPELIHLPEDLFIPNPNSVSSLSSSSPPHSTSQHQRRLSPIIPILTPHARPLASQLRTQGFNARPITWPTVPKGKERVRICLHAGNSRAEVEGLVREIVRWVELGGVGMLERQSEVALRGASGVVGGDDVRAGEWRQADSGGAGVRAATAKL